MVGAVRALGSPEYSLRLTRDLNQQASHMPHEIPDGLTDHLVSEADP